jgi:YgiT-type zinc finger domain-containing protein
MTETMCPACGGRLESKMAPFGYAGASLGIFPAEVCVHCGETYFTEAGARAIERPAKAKGVWGSARRANIGQSSHSLILRIPAQLAAATNLKRGSIVVLEPAGKWPVAGEPGTPHVGDGAVVPQCAQARSPSILYDPIPLPLKPPAPVKNEITAFRELIGT